MLARCRLAGLALSHVDCYQFCLALQRIVEPNVFVNGRRDRNRDVAADIEFGKASWLEPLRDVYENTDPH